MTTRSIILSSRDVVENSNNTVLRYRLNGAEDFKDKEIAVASIQMYNSVFNIDSQLYNNNTFQYMWYSASGVLDQTFSVTIPDGYYDTTSLNEYLIYQMTINGHYLEHSSTKDRKYYYTFADNVSRYAVQIVCAKLPQTTDYVTGTEGYRRGSSSWTAPAASTCGQIRFLITNNFSELIGYTKGQNIPVTPSGSTFQTLSNFVPKQLMVSSIILTSNIVENKFSNPSNLLTSFTISQAAFGAMAIITPNNLIFQSCSPSLVNSIELRMFDQDMKLFKIQDRQMLFNIIIRDKVKVKE